MSNSARCDYPRLHIAADFTKFFDPTGVVTRSEKRGDVPCLVVSRKSVKLDQAVWMSERDGCNPVFFADAMDFDDGPETRTTEVSWQRTAGGHFYPKSVKHNSIIRVGGGKYPSEEVVTVTHADFDSPIDPTVFTLAGLGLNENQVIGLPGLDHMSRPLWRNGKVDPAYTVGKREEEMPGGPPIEGQGTGGPATKAPYPSQGNTALVVGVVAGILAVATAVTAVVLRRRRAAG